MSYSLHFTGNGSTRKVKEITANFDSTAQAIVLIVLLRGQDYLAQIFISLNHKPKRFKTSQIPLKQ